VTFLLSFWQCCELSLVSPAYSQLFANEKHPKLFRKIAAEKLLRPKLFLRRIRFV
jgi:hypothetical protein